MSAGGRSCTLVPCVANRAAPQLEALETCGVDREAPGVEEREARVVAAWTAAAENDADPAVRLFCTGCRGRDQALLGSVSSTGVVEWPLVQQHFASPRRPRHTVWRAKDAPGVRRRGGPNAILHVALLYDRWLDDDSVPSVRCWSDGERLLQWIQLREAFEEWSRSGGVTQNLGV